MVCIRCKIVVASELEKLGLHYSNLEIGEVNIIESITEEQKEAFNAALKKSLSIKSWKLYFSGFAQIIVTGLIVWQMLIWFI